ncbi:MAG: hypothetical protein WAT35_00465, partial [Tabrizicola sp.]
MPPEDGGDAQPLHCADPLPQEPGGEEDGQHPEKRGRDRGIFGSGKGARGGDEAKSDGVEPPHQGEQPGLATLRPDRGAKNHGEGQDGRQCDEATDQHDRKLGPLP